MNANANPAQAPRAAWVAPTPVLDLDKRQDFSNPTEASLIGVLVTGVPPSILSLAVTNPPELYSLLVSDFSDGSYPDWYNELPVDVQCYLTEGTVCPASQLQGSSTTSTRLPRPTNSGTSEGLSTGAKAGIGVGVALGVIALIAALVFLCLWQRKKKKKRVQAQSQMPPPAAAGPMQQGQPTAYYSKTQPYVQQPPVQQAPSPVSSYGPNDGYHYQQQSQYGAPYLQPQQGHYAQVPQQETYNPQHAPPQPQPQQQPQQQQYVQELPTHVTRPQEMPGA